jgi:hypothetical protein
MVTLVSTHSPLRELCRSLSVAVIAGYGSGKSTNEEGNGREDGEVCGHLQVAQVKVKC